MRVAYHLWGLYFRFIFLEFLSIFQTTSRHVPAYRLFSQRALFARLRLLLSFNYFLVLKKSTATFGMLPVKRTIKNNKFLYRQPCYGWRYFMLLLYIAHDISLVSLHAVSFEVVGCCSNLCN